ncbi:MAG TPA: hypothetical protein VFS66_07515 [Acidimicrobiia bacterium]|nr:hypothetical protein [Acidimicrobiia bacterium]
MTIWEYLRDPGPWFNTEAYTPIQIGMFTFGAVLWIVVYVLTIRRLVRVRELAIPFLAVTLNFGTEITTSIFFVPDMGSVLVIAYWAWMVLDLFIVIGMFRYGSKQVTTPYLKQRFRWLMAGWLPLLFMVQLTFILQYDYPMAPLNSFMINLVMSAAFITLFFVPSVGGSSKVIGWCKFLGTGIIGVMFYTKYPENNALTSLYVAVALLDVFYLGLLYRVRRPVVADAATI